MRTEKKLQPDFSTRTGSENPTPALRSKGHETPDDSPKPKVPPRMKKKGPARPEKPPHLRQPPSLSFHTPAVINTSHQESNVKDTDHSKQQSNSGASNENVVFPKLQREDRHHPNSSQREVLVAASRTARDRPVERRQREPAKFLPAPPVPNKPQDSEGEDPEPIIFHIKTRTQKTENKVSEPPTQKKSEKSKGAAIFNFRKNRTPMVLIPRGHPLLDSRHLTHMWGGVYPTAYAMWLQSYDNGEPSSLSASSGLLRPIFGSSVDLRPYGVAGHGKGHQRSRAADPMGTRSGVKSSKSSKHSPVSVLPSAKPRSSSVTRSGSLTSHGSTSSDSGNETFPKSVLKKQKRTSSKNAEQKKNVTFNAFATVQLMEE